MSIPFKSDMMGKETIYTKVLTDHSEEEKNFLHIGRKEFIDKRIKRSPLCNLRNAASSKSRA